MIRPPLRINAKTDKGRPIILHPIWCDKKKEYLLYDEAVTQYRNAFNTGPEILVAIMMDGKDVSLKRFVINKVNEGDIALRSSIGNNDDRFTIVSSIDEANSSSMSMKTATTDLSCHHSHRIKHSPVMATTMKLEKLLKSNTEFNVEVVNTNGLKIHLLNVPPGKFVGADDNTKPEIHENVTQTILVQTGKALVRLYVKNKETGDLEQAEVVFISSKKDDTIIIPSNTYHLIENVDTIPFTAVSIYAPVG